MKYVILCGGIGKRLNTYSLPKPLNYINGKHMIEYIIENINSDEIYIVYYKYLCNYNFEEIIINLFKNKKFYFSIIDYLTRGAVESAYIGLKKFNITNLDENIVFLDNDNIHNINNLDLIFNNFIGYGIDYEKTNYSFIEIIDNKIINIKEKVKISDNYCCGVYGFKNINLFNKYALDYIEKNLKTKNEFYFSQLYKLLIINNEEITPFFIDKTSHIGLYDELTTYNSNNKLRICFDLDNTLVSYPAIPYDYSTVKPIHKNIDLLTKLKNSGHEIIIHTARRMKTHNHNVGKVIKDIASITIETLEKFNIEYDELIFGKPYADIYIDDKAINPYINDISYFGLLLNDNNNLNHYIHNKVSNNKYNTIIKENDIIIKTGPVAFMKGELYFYQNIPESLNIFFTKLINYKNIDEKLQISMQHINGIPLYFLYKNNLLFEKHIDDLFNILNKIHNTTNTININDDDIYKNYFDKLINRFNFRDYFFHDSNDVFLNIMDGLKKYYSPKIAGIIHGDFWFSNIILEYDDNYKFIDMKGQVNNNLSLNGDIYYDYGKLYQSILGFDLILNNDIININYITKIKNYFLSKCLEKNLNLDYLYFVTKSLIFGTLHFIETDENKTKIWNFLKSI